MRGDWDRIALLIVVVMRHMLVVMPVRRACDDSFTMLTRMLSHPYRDEHGAQGKERTPKQRDRNAAHVMNLIGNLTFVQLQPAARAL